jgi:hypothetical protein
VKVIHRLVPNSKFRAWHVIARGPAMALKLNKPLLSGTAEVNRMELLLRSDADFDAKISL